MIPASPSESFINSLAHQLNVRPEYLLELAESRIRLKLPSKHRIDAGQLKISLSRQADIYDEILRHSHPVPGQNSSIKMATNKVVNLGTKMFLRLAFNMIKFSIKLNNHLYLSILASTVK